MVKQWNATLNNYDILCPKAAGSTFPRNVITTYNAVFCSHLPTLVPRLRIFLLWRRRRYVPPKRRFTQDLHGATTQETAFFIVTAVKTWNLTSTYKITLCRNPEDYRRGQRVPPTWRRQPTGLNGLIAKNIIQPNQDFKLDKHFLWILEPYIRYYWTPDVISNPSSYCALMEVFRNCRSV
jgi:hypothetical protein